MPQTPFVLHWEEGPIELSPGEPFSLELTISVPEGYYLYAEETEVDFASLEGLIVTDVRLPRATKFSDPYMGKVVDVLRGEVVISVVGRVPQGLSTGEHDLVARVAFRGCSPTICYRAEQREAQFRVSITASAEGGGPSVQQGEKPALRDDQAMTPEPSSPGLRAMFEVEDFGALLDRGLGWTLLIVFVAGILTSLTPCVWPVIPVVLLFVGVHPHRRFWRNLLLACTLVSGMILVYAALGVVAVLLGKNLGFLFQQRLFLALVVLFFLAMSLAMFGVFHVRMPRRLQSRLHRMGGEGYRGAFLAGMATGLVASPCAGPVLAAVLGYVALQRNYATGFSLLVVYGMGMGLIMVFLGACYGELAGKLKGGPWTVWIRRMLGILLLFPAAFYMGSLFGWGGPSSPFGLGEKAGVRWMTDEAGAFNLARELGRPVMIEFRAEWCPPCKAMERRFFSRPDIAELLERVVPLQVDATTETPEVRGMVDKYRVVGWPTVLFLAPDGKSWNDLRVSDYNPAAVERALREAIRRSEGPGASPGP